MSNRAHYLFGKSLKVLWGFYNHTSYNLGFLQLEVLQLAVVTTRGLTTTGSYTHGSYNLGCLLYTSDAADE